MKHATEKVHIDQVRPGDTIVHYGEEKTVCNSNIHRNTFMGTTIFGDSYRLGTKPVIRIIYPSNR